MSNRIDDMGLEEAAETALNNINNGLVRLVDLETLRALSAQLAKVQVLVDALEKIKRRDGRGSSYTICHECSDSSEEASAALAQFKEGKD